MNQTEVRQMITDALVRASLRNNPVLPPDPRGLVLYKVLKGGDTDTGDLIGVLYDEASEIRFNGVPLIKAADEAAREEGIAPRWGSGRRNAQDAGGYPGYFLAQVRNYIRAFILWPDLVDPALRLVADYWMNRVLECAKAHGYTQDPETHLWVPPPKK